MLPGDPEQLRKRVPAGRLGRPDEVADLAVAILANPYLTSQDKPSGTSTHPDAPHETAKPGPAPYRAGLASARRARSS
jgi:hypothetical protein